MCVETGHVSIALAFGTLLHLMSVSMPCLLDLSCICMCTISAAVLSFAGVRGIHLPCNINDIYLFIHSVKSIAYNIFMILG